MDPSFDVSYIGDPRRVPSVFDSTASRRVDVPTVRKASDGTILLVWPGEATTCVVAREVIAELVASHNRLVQVRNTLKELLS